MEHLEQTNQPREVVLEYRQPDCREVVEQYSCPLPKRRRVRQAPPAPVKQKKKRRIGLWVFLGLLAVIVLAAAVGLLVDEIYLRADTDFDHDFPWEEYQPFFEEHFVKEDSRTEEITIPVWQAETGVTLDVQTDHGETLSPQEIYKRVNPAVVTVSVELEDGMGSVGTGVIFTEDGYLLTNHHVVAGGSECWVMLESGYSYEAKFVAGDAGQDLAILKIDQMGLPAAEFGDSSLLTVGDPVYAIGNPLGFELRGTLTDGIVSAMDRDVQVNDGTMTLIQTNAALNEGNSGGPLINQYGQVVGINVIKMDSEFSTIEGLGFAIPSSAMRRMVNDLLIYGELQPEPVLGLMVMNMGQQLTDTIWGAEVDSVTEGGAADRAGVQAGDFIIAAGSLEEVLGSNDVLHARRQYHVGDQMPMTLWRDGEIIEVILDLQEAAE